MAIACELAKRCLPDYSSKFSRKDFTLPQLFACLVVREHQNKSYRGVEALLRDSEHWCKQIGMRRVPDHNTLCRAFKVILSGSCIGRLLDLLPRWMGLQGDGNRLRSRLNALRHAPPLTALRAALPTLQQPR